MQQQVNSDGCGAMVVWYLRIAAYVGLVVGTLGMLTSTQSAWAAGLLVISLLWLLITRKKP